MGGHVASDSEIGVTLSWEENCDLDLQCVLPNGQLCNYQTRNVGAATLDVDKTGGGGLKVENIFIQESGRTPGKYTFRVNYYRGSGSCPYKAIVYDRGSTKTIPGTCVTAKQTYT